MGCDVCIGGWDQSYDSSGFHSAQWRKARKPHKCCECGREIKRGDRYEYVSAKYDGELFTEKTCELCQEIRRVFSCGQGYLYEALWDEMHDYAFQNLTTASECFTQLSTAAKERVLEEWRKWKGLPA